MTNNQLDLILRTLAEKKEQLMSSMCREPGKRQRRYKPNRQKSKSHNHKSSSYASFSMRKCNDVTNYRNVVCSWPASISSACIPQLPFNRHMTYVAGRGPSRNFFVSPYFPPYFIKPISHYNYFKTFGLKCAESDMSNNFWSPFMFMACNFNANNFQNRMIKNTQSDNGSDFMYIEEKRSEENLEPDENSSGKKEDRESNDQSTLTNLGENASLRLQETKPGTSDQCSSAIDLRDVK